jgi:hypothetical protein
MCNTDEVYVDKSTTLFWLLGYLGDLENKVQIEENGTTVRRNVHWFYATGKVNRLVCQAWVILSMPEAGLAKTERQR